MLMCSGGVSFKMIFKVLVSVAFLLVSIEARAFPLGNGKSLDQLIREFKDMEKVRHEALQVVLNKPEYKEDENMVKYMATLTEMDRNLVETRKVIKDVPSLLHSDERDTAKTQEILANLKQLRSESVVLMNKRTEQEQAVSADVLGDNEVQMLMASFGVSGKKLMEIGLKMLMEVIASQNYMRAGYYSPAAVAVNNYARVATAYLNELTHVN